MALHIGTCGFSYRDWVGPFYPKGIASIEMLPFYAQRFSAVEIDSTYYAIPKPALFASMDKRTPKDFRFTVKAPGSITHVPAGASPPETDPAAFAEALAPLVSAGKLAAVLVQFPNSFRPGSDAYRRLEQLRTWWPEMNLIAEFRHRDWQRDDTLRRLRGLSIGWCNVDEPRFRSLLRPGAEVTSDTGYIRFHGRNYGEWWKKSGKADERYNYSYSGTELAEWIPRIAAVEEQTHDTYVFFNNHRLGKAPANARQLADMLQPHETNGRMS